MNPEEIIQKLFQGFQEGKADIKLIPKDDGGFGIIYGNNARKGVYELNPRISTTSSAMNYDELLYDNKYPSLRSFGADASKIEASKNDILRQIKSGEYTLDFKGEYNREQLLKQYNKHQRGITDQEIQKANTKNSNEGFDPDFSSTTGTAKTLGVMAYNGVVGTAVNAVESTYGVGKDLITGGVEGFTKTGKDIWGGAVNLAGNVLSGLAAGNSLLKSWAVTGNMPTVEDVQNRYDVYKNSWDNFAKPITPEYNDREKALIEKNYNDQYTKVFEDLKKDAQVQYKQPEGQPSWDNKDWLEYTFAQGMQSAGEFMGGLYLSNFLLTKGAGALGEKAYRAYSGAMKGKKEAQVAANAKAEILKRVEAPDFENPLIKDYIQSRIGKVAVELENGARKAQETGQVMGSTGAMLAGTKFESDLEAFGAYQQYMDDARERRTKELQALGLPPDRLDEALKATDFSKDKAEAMRRAENVRKANLIILGFSNLATFRLLGLTPKTNMMGKFGEAVKDAAPITEEILAPWYHKAADGTLELIKEGGEEAFQQGITNYEMSKESKGSNALASVVNGGLDAVKGLLTLDPEMTMNFITGAAGSGGFMAARWGMGKIRNQATERNLKFIDKDAINSTVTDPITVNDNVKANLAYTVDAMRNEIGKTVADVKNDWQLRHVLEAEGINKLYYQARKNGVSHEDTVKKIIGALNARTDDKISIKHNTPYFGYADTKAQLKEVERGLSETEKSYDHTLAEVKRLERKGITLDPEKTKRLFEAIANQREFHNLNAFLKEKNMDQDLPDNIKEEAAKDLKVNESYVSAYPNILKKLIGNEKELRKESDDYKVDIAKQTAENGGAGVEENIDNLAKSVEEKDRLYRKVEDQRQARKQSDFEQETADFKSKLDQLFKEGHLRSAMGDTSKLDVDTVEGMLLGYEEATKGYAKSDELKKQRDSVIRTAVRKIRDAAGNQNLELLGNRYDNSEPHKAYLFHTDKGSIASKLESNPEADPMLADAIRNVKNTQELSALVNDPELDPTDKRIIHTFYSRGANTTEQAIPEFQDDSLVLSDHPEIEEEGVQQDSFELTEKSIDELLNNEYLIKPCNV